ncbi:MAG: hypothetical protein AB7P99_21295 [Vicinamibacterales bacterium]
MIVIHPALLRRMCGFEVHNFAGSLGMVASNRRLRSGVNVIVLRYAL